MASTEMPIVGFDGDQPNDSFRDQLVMNAKSAIDKIVDMGVGDRDRQCWWTFLWSFYDCTYWLTRSICCWNRCEVKFTTEPLHLLDSRERRGLLGRSRSIQLYVTFYARK